MGDMRDGQRTPSLRASMKLSLDTISMSSPAIYRVRIHGRLDADLAKRLDGINLSEESPSSEGGNPISILVGRFVDQAALSGLLNSLYEFHLPLLSVDCLDVEVRGEAD